MTTPKITTRMERGIGLFRKRGHEIIEAAPGVYKVPSCSGKATYAVDLNRERCSCPDRVTPCKHLFAATIFAAKKRCRRATTERPQRRHGQPRENQRDGARRGGDNTPAAPDISAPRRTDEVGSDSLRGVLVNPERLAETAEKLGV